MGPAVKDWKIGDRAGGAWHGGSEGHCKACTRATPQICEGLEVNGVTRNGGCKYLFLYLNVTFPLLQALRASSST